MENVATPQEGLTAVAIDRDKNSRFAIRWAISNINITKNGVILVHVNTKQHFQPQDLVPKEGRAPTKLELQQLFTSFREYCARKAVLTKEVVLDDLNIAYALASFISNNFITTIVLGASNRGSIARTFRSAGVATTLAKLAPAFCVVYAIAKDKVQNVSQESRKNVSYKESSVDQGRYSMSSERSSDLMQISPYKKSGSKISSPQHLSHNVNIQVLSKSSPSHSSSSLRNHSRPPSSQPSTTSSFNSLDGAQLSNAFKSPFVCQILGQVEEELRRLRLVLKQTLELYNSACKEALRAKEKVREVDQWKLEEAWRLEEAKQAQEAALAILEIERQKYKVAVDAAEMAKRLAELEAERRKGAEMRFQQEQEEKKKAMEVLAQKDISYRRYFIQEIEMATNYFSDSEKIGEGRYGPVYKGYLDYTTVAIKVLRPDISQGRNQFNREIEVSSLVRHPHLVLLLGACPEHECLVYEYMENGSLEDRLFCRNNSRPIPCSTRLKIATEIASALLFFHERKPEPLVHLGLKPANIFLDQNYVSKIGNVGLVRLASDPDAEYITQHCKIGVTESFCYMNLDYEQTGMLGTKSNLYSLGITMLQIITAKPPMGLTHHVAYAIENGEFTNILDPTVKDWPVEEALSFAKLALECSEQSERDRPDLGSVVLPELERLRDLASENGGISQASSIDQSFPESSVMSEEKRRDTSEILPKTQTNTSESGTNSYAST